MADKEELIDAGKEAEKAPDVKEAPTKPATPEPPKAAPPSGLTEPKNEPHMHLMILLIIVIILGVVIAFVKF